jgi:hypothetical protein
MIDKAKPLVAALTKLAAKHPRPDRTCSACSQYSRIAGITCGGVSLAISGSSRGRITLA